MIRPNPRPVHTGLGASLYPTLDSLEEAEKFAFSKLPNLTHNDMRNVLMVYQNTLLKVIGRIPS